MLTAVSFLLTWFATVLAVISAVLFSEVLAASFLSPRRCEGRDDKPRGRVAVLVPAHNEGSGLVATLDDLKGQLRPGDRLLVVADNCTDDTAAVAVTSGAEVTIRSDLTKIGKGYALDWGVKYLCDDPPEIVVIVDADCRIKADAIDQLAIASANARRPVQALYLMNAPAGAKINLQVAEFAWRLKNWVRPRGLNALGLPCQLMGTGMAFPWIIIRNAALSSDSLVEDLKLGLELGCAGFPPLFCPTAVITSTFPDSAEGARRQRQRWEHGHVWLILTQAPVLLHTVVKRRDLHLLALLLNLLVPPLSLLGILLVGSFIVDGIAIMAGISSAAFIISAASLLIVFASLGLAWFKYGRDILPARSLGLLASHFAVKLRTYGAVVLGDRVSSWTRADRS